MSNQQTIYLDHAASTPSDPQVVATMLPYFTEIYGNASGLHQQARASAEAIKKARQQIAEILGCKPKEIIFTGCGSESDNLAVRGIALAQRKAGRGHHIITSPIEHSAVRNTVQQL
jgi:cysteine desulfurase